MEKKKKSHRKSSAPKIKDLDVQQRKLALIKQKKCDAIALHIVRKLIDSAVEEDVFIQSLKYLNQCHYQDIVEERAIIKICGYPICGSKIIDMPSKKFHISTKTNKVYDITERKNYCSNFCYKAGVHIKDQMLISPLWFRDKEEIPEFRLLPKTETGIPGQEIDQGLLKLDVDEPDQNFTSISEFTQERINEIPEIVYDHINVERDASSKEELKNEQEISKDFSNFYCPTIADILKENAEYFQNESADKTKQNESPRHKKVDDKQIENKKEKVSEKLENEVKPSTSKSETCKIGFNRTIINSKSSNQQKSIGILKKSKHKASQKKRVSFSAENSIKELEPTEPEANNEFKNPETSKPDLNNVRRFKNTNVIGIVQERSTIVTENTSENENNDLKQQLNNKEIRLSRLKSSSTFKAANRISKPSLHSSNSSKSSLTNLKSRLQTSLSEWLTFESALFLYGEENVKKIISEKSFKHYLNKKKNLELDENKQKQYDEICKRLCLIELADRKFDESITGRKRGPLPRYEDLREASEHLDLRVQAFYSGCYEDDDDDPDTESVEEEDGERNLHGEEGQPAVLPLVDNKDVMATRRKIFLMCISRTISSICEILKDSPNKLMAEIKHLINTFEFSATNIVFKAIEWELVTVLLIRILSVRDSELHATLASNEVTKYLASLTSHFGLQVDFIQQVLSQVDVQNLLDECMRKDCIE